jgi:hypothetical protein
MLCSSLDGYTEIPFAFVFNLLLPKAIFMHADSVSIMIPIACRSHILKQLKKREKKEIVVLDAGKEIIKILTQCA